jgi:methylmalonyl-CoA mutase cobalamin-binding domain/chain
VEDVPIIAGDTIPPDDAAALRKMGVREVFLPGTDTADVVRCIEMIVN